MERITAFFLVAVSVGLFVASCEQSTAVSDELDLPPPPVPATAKSDQSTRVISQSPADLQQIFEIPAGSRVLDDLQHGIQLFQLFHRVGSRTDELSPPPVVKIDGKIALKSAIRFTGENHFLIYRALANPLHLRSFRDIVILVRSGDDVETQISVGAEQLGKIFSSNKYAAEATEKMWSRLVIPIAELKDRSGASLDLDEPLKSVYLILDRSEKQQPDPPVEKVIYIGGLFLAP